MLPLIRRDKDFSIAGVPPDPDTRARSKENPAAAALPDDARSVEAWEEAPGLEPVGRIAVPFV